MPNKNSIESEIDKLIEDLLDGSSTHDWEFVDIEKRWNEATEQLKNLIQREVKKGRVEELDALHDDLSIEAREAGACEAIHKRANSLLDRLEELEG